MKLKKNNNNKWFVFHIIQSDMEKMYEIIIFFRPNMNFFFFAKMKKKSLICVATKSGFPKLYFESHLELPKGLSQGGGFH